MKLLAIDGNSLINRAFHATANQNFTSSDGQPTGAINGFLNTIHKLLADHKPDALCVAFDVKAKTFRHLKFPDYKGGRKPTSPDLLSQFPLIKEILSALQIPYFSAEGWEADDILGTLAKINEDANWETILVSGDKDLYQLISEKTSIYYPSTTGYIHYTATSFQETFGFPAPHIVDLKAFVGDNSDNLDGIKGVGEKTILPAIQLYHSLETIYQKLQDPNETLGLSKGMLKKVREGEEETRMCYDLATIRTNAPIENYTPDSCLLQEPNKKLLHTLLAKLDLYKLIEYYNLTQEQIDPTTLLGSYLSEEVTRPERAKELLSIWENQTLTVLPLPNLTGIAIHHAQEPESLIALFLETSYPYYSSFLQSFFQAPLNLHVFQSKTLQHDLLQEGISATNIIFDIELAAYLLSPESKEYTIDSLSKHYFKFTPDAEELYTDPQSFSPLSDRSLALGTWMTHTAILSTLSKTLLKKLETENLLPLLQTIELPLCPVLAKMEVSGISINQNALSLYGEKLNNRLNALEVLIIAEAGEPFNISSPKQLGVILFEKLGLPSHKKTKTGYSTNVDVLEELQKEHPEISILTYILEHRHLSKLHSTYVKGLKKVITPQGKIHTTLKNTVTTTGRLSSAEPNLQNIPIRTPLGSELRYMFIADPNTVLIGADYSQIELRLLAHLADDEAMISAFLSKEDFHSQTASKLLNIPLEEVDSSMRRNAKAVNFGIIYGKKAFSLSQDLGISVFEANDYIENYFATYPKVKSFLDSIVSTTQANKFITTLYGRKRWIPNINSSNKLKQNAAIREAQNLPMQGTAADIMKLAMIAVDNLLNHYPEANLVLQIHDEILVQCPQSQSQELCQKIKETMENVAQLSVPLIVDAKIGNSWGDAH